MTLVERVANLVRRSTASAADYGGDPEKVSRLIARAAIAAIFDHLETPTAVMLKAASQEEDRCAIENYGGRPSSDDIWSAMLQAAREEMGHD